jgi:hypothetical protein
MEQEQDLTRKTILPERKFNLVQNSIDFFVLLALLYKPSPSKKTVGGLISSRGISRRYIFDLIGRYDRKSIEKYVNALADRAGQSYDEVVEERPVI